MNRRLGFAVLWGAIFILASVPVWLTLPKPEGAHAITSALQITDKGERAITLPMARQTPGSWGHYRFEFDSDFGSDIDSYPASDTATPKYLFIPLLSQRAMITLNGTPIDDTQNRTVMVGLASGVPAMIPLPETLVNDGQNVIDLRLQSVGLIPAYLSPLYVGSADQLSSHYRLRVFVLEYLKLMVPAGQLLIALVVLMVWLYRPQDPLFGWLAVTLLLSMVTYLGMAQDLIPQLVTLMPYFSMTGSAAAIAMVVVVLLIAGRPPPRWLQWLAFALPASSVLLALSGVLPPKLGVVLVSAPTNILGLLVSLVILGWAAMRHHLKEAWLLLLPMLMAVIAGIHDFAMVLSLLDGPLFLSVYYRPLLLIGFAMILMRRLGISLSTLDDVNAYLTQRLAEREHELERLYEEERREAAQRVRGEERQRLTRDLHDGLSGHLVSIIALSEQEQAASIERTAREALDDLRLVIHSLDITDNELPLALSSLRERLERQLKRLNIELDWSIAQLPEIAGVTPTHALSILRILQEAITNAVKHGRASRIVVRGNKGENGDGNAHERAVISVENDGQPFPHNPSRNGNGLNNMRRRMNQLNGTVEIMPLEQGTRLTLGLPLQLPDVSSRP